MANDLNLCQFIGRLGKDPELRVTQAGKNVVTLSVAVGSKRKDQQTGQIIENTEWVRVVAFDKLADIIKQYTRKGSQVYISGRFRTRKWQNQQGIDQYTTEIVADKMQMLDSRDGQQAPQRQPAQQQQQPAQNNQQQYQQQGVGFDDFSDDITFANYELRVLV